MPEWMSRHWYPVVNDLVGGWAVATVNLPLSRIDTSSGSGEWAPIETIDHATAAHICDLHNRGLLS